jgi:hypothetical protein
MLCNVWQQILLAFENRHHTLTFQMQLTQDMENSDNLQPRYIYVP